MLIAVLAYVALQLAIGFLLIRRSSSSESDYLLAGRRLGYPLAIFSIFATWFGAETCVGAAGQAYENGLAGGRADPFGYTLCLVGMGLLFALPLYRRKLMTLADLFRVRYSAPVERFAALLLAPSSLLWASAQIRAFGIVLSSSSELDFELALLIATGVVIVYTVSGGLLADAVTDIVQGAVLIVGLVVVTYFVLDASGGVSQALSSVPGDRLRLSVAGESWWARADGWAVPICGSVVAQELVSRVLASRSATLAQRATLWAALLYLAVGLLPILLGLVAPALLPSIADSEAVLPELARRHLPTFGYVLFAGALVSAILSTVDSALLAAASLISHNLIVSLRPETPDRTRVTWARAGVVVFGIIAYVLAAGSSSVYELAEQASGFASSGILVVVCFGLFTRFGGPRAATAALVVGVVTWLAGAHVLEWTAPYLASLGAATAAYCVFPLFGWERTARAELATTEG